MIKIAILTVGKSGKRILDMCRKIEGGVEVAEFIDNNANLYGRVVEGIKIVSPYALRKDIEEGYIEMVLVPSDRMISYGLRDFISQLDDLRIDKYKIIPAWLTIKENIDSDDVAKLKKIIKHGDYKKINQLQHLQFHVIDNCNLNCKRCQHFSNVADKDSYADFESIKQDFYRLRYLLDDIRRIAILGGEPLLNKELPQYVSMISELFPHSILEIITNGILVRQMSRELIELIKDKNVLINVSFYPVLENSIEDIVRFLSDEGIRFKIGPHIDTFSKRLIENKEESNEIKYNKCRDACCTTLRNHKIYPCYLPATVHILNQKLKMNICPVDDGIDIYEDGITGIDIVERLKKPFDACSYCGIEEIYKWERTDNVCREDWFVD